MRRMGVQFRHHGFHEETPGSRCLCQMMRVYLKYKGDRQFGMSRDKRYFGCSIWVPDRVEIGRPYVLDGVNLGENFTKVMTKGSKFDEGRETLG